MNISTNEKLARVVAQLLRAKGMKVSFAESCTGGLLAATFASVSGISDILDLSFVTYANWAKINYTNVTQDILDEFGAVSEHTAVLMASGVRERSGSNIGVGVTGIAGPEGGSIDKPVGTVYIAFAIEEDTIVEHFNFSGDRNEIRKQTVRQALTLLGECV
ncbi:MAG: CinA family protein [Oscillospiraceae bacterium]|nr:CinA family protein [Oscillospiraceae bacterium]